MSLVLLPEEILLHILGFLQDPIDVAHMGSTCVYYHGVLDSRMKAWRSLDIDQQMIYAASSGLYNVLDILLRENKKPVLFGPLVDAAIEGGHPHIAQYIQYVRCKTWEKVFSEEIITRENVER